MAHFEFSSIISAPRTETFDYVSNINSLPEIMASDYKIETTSPVSKLKKGSEYEIKITRLGISVLWGIVIEEFEANEYVRDRQSHGPFALWVHTQKFEDHGESTLLTDLIEYDVPFGLLGKLADDIFVRRDLGGIFRHRHEKIQSYFISSALASRK
jgi:ligand-binding SRPBCC domain-containing protein